MRGLQATIFYHVFEKNAWLGGTNYFNNLDSITRRFIPTFTMIGVNLDRIPLPKRSKFYHYLVQAKLLQRRSKAGEIQSYLSREAQGKHFCLFTIFPDHFKLIGSAPKVFWIPDFQVFYLPQFFSEEEISSRKENFRIGTETADVVVLSSEAAKKDFEKYFPEHKDKARVLRFVKEVPDACFQESCSYVLAKYNLPEKYFYVPNQFWQHKNHVVVLKALKSLKESGEPVSVVFTGSAADHRNREFYCTILSTIEEWGIGEDIKILGAVPQEDVYQLLRQSVAVINPSLFEGWSTTVEEVKSIGKRVILSNIEVHVEQDPAHATFFPAHDHLSLAAAMSKIWREQSPGADRVLEVEANQLLPTRLHQFARDFQKLIIDLF